MDIMAKKFSKTYVSRRSFIGTAAASAFTFNFFPKRVFGANDRIAFAGIGVGGKGSGDIDQAGNLGDVVALCDIDLTKLDAKGEKFAKAKKYKDFRKMLEEMHTEIDAVTISTPDHMHAPAGLLAMSLGKHVYCQKPLTHSVYEARRMGQVARQYKVATQMGNQGTASDGLRRGVEVIQSGAIGAVREVHVWTNRPVWPQAPSITARPNETPAIPNHVDWHLFLGVAPDRPYHNAYHPFKWRGWWDFGTGAIGDMSCHTANLAFMALNLGHPLSVEALDHGPINEETFPAWATTKTEFGARGAMPPLSYYWYEGKFPDGKKNLPPMDLFHGEKPTNSGSIIVGDKGILYSPNDYGSSWKLLPGDDFNDYEAPDAWIPRIGGGDQAMKNEWVEAMRGGKPALSNFDYASQMTESILLGNAALKAGGRIEWDSTRLQAKNMDISDIIQREYRPGWMA
ncbi:Gfo/Idh/MocA family oxidoreductase [Verrucomicrobia bacterium]|nr:Gfo/Idh/MocA family oxidoreductase [Verrucomicrobiota bacterium]